MTLLRSILRGSIGFAIVSIAGFAVWAFGSDHLTWLAGEGGLYAGCTVVFLAVSGLLLHPLVSGEKSLGRFYRIFIPAFLAYAALWCVFWFWLGMGRGEWLGSLAGSAAFAFIVCLMLRRLGPWLAGALVLFAAHSAGYFIGGELYYPSKRLPLDMLTWGLIYGLGFGAGIGFVFWAAQRGGK